MVIGACSLLKTLKTVHAILASNSDYGEFFFFSLKTKQRLRSFILLHEKITNLLRVVV